jgi:AraC family transcriptional regulator
VRVKLIVDIINHIEDHLHEDLNVQEVARFSGYSSHHFQKMFAAVVGISLGTYIRRRRLTKAAKRLVSTSDRIIDIALDSGIDSQEAFTRAFKSMFELTPKEYRDRGLTPGLRSQQQMTGQFVHHLRHEGVDMQPRFETKKEFYVMALGKVFERDNTKEIGDYLWPRFIKRFEEIPNKLGQDGPFYVTYGICKEIWKKNQIQDQFNYYAAVEVDKNTKPIDGMELIHIVEQRYAIFTHRGGLKELSLTNQYIWGTWLPQSGLELADAMDLEVYPSNFQPPHNEVPFEIWMPIRAER